ncbi:MAG: hypothetical protein ACI9X4_002084, partial [Glaciecola sp.]
PEKKGRAGKRSILGLALKSHKSRRVIKARQFQRLSEECRDGGMATQISLRWFVCLLTAKLDGNLKC